MSEYDELLEKLLDLKPGLARADIEDRIRQKKEKIGAGYLTDQGALFLIASDLGISLSEPLKVEMGLKDLYSGAKEISLETRVLSMSPARQLSRKAGSPFYLRTMTVYDSDSTASVKLWDEKANMPGLEDLRPGDLIKIIKAYVKSDIKGALAINVGSGSSVEPADSESDIPGIDSITKDAGEVKEGDRNLAVSGTIDGDISSMQFTNSRGRPGKAIRTRIKGKDGASVRVVVWGKDESDIPAMISRGAKIRLLGASVKSGNQGIEIHGNEGTIVEIEGGGEAEPIASRIISITDADGKRLVQSVDGKKNVFSITDLTGSTGMYSEGDVIECMPSKVYGQMVTLDGNSFVRKLEDDGSLPGLADVRTKINDVKVDGSYCIEAIILKGPDRREIQTRSGETVALSEMFVEDDTGQIWVKGWRNQARLVDGCGLGEIVSVTGLSARPGLEGRTELVLSQFSKITKKN